MAHPLAVHVAARLGHAMATAAGGGDSSGCGAAGRPCARAERSGRDMMQSARHLVLPPQAGADG